MLVYESEPSLGVPGSCIETKHFSALANPVAYLFNGEGNSEISAAVVVPVSTQSRIRLNAYRACARMRSDRF